MALSGRWIRPALRWLAGLALLVVLAAASIAFALLVTPMQRVTVAGQVIQVGASAPDLSLSGPGQVDLFGQTLPTNLRFTGPVRPRLQLSQISINSELTTFIEGARRGDAKRILGARLADGWKRYFTWETVVTGAGALVLDPVLKSLVGRLRPVVAHPIAHGTGDSFPSGHSLGSIVCYGAVLLIFLPAAGGAPRLSPRSSRSSR